MTSKSEFQKILDSFETEKQPERSPLTFAEETVILNGSMPFINAQDNGKATATKGFSAISRYSNWTHTFAFFDPWETKSSCYETPLKCQIPENADQVSELKPEKKTQDNDPTISFKNLNSAEVFAWLYFEKKVKNWPQNLTYSRLKKVYKILALRFHPDHNSGHSSEFLTLKECFQTLSRMF